MRLIKSLLQARQVAMKLSGGRCVLWDDEVTGFGARVSKRAITFVVRYQRGPHERRMTIGTLGEFGTVEQARKAAAQVRLAVRAGGDPLQELRAKRKPVAQGVTLEAAIKRWLASNPQWSKPTADTYRKALER